MRNSKASSLKWWIIVPLVIAALGMGAILLLGPESSQDGGFIYTIK